MPSCASIVGIHGFRGSTRPRHVTEQSAQSTACSRSIPVSFGQNVALESADWSLLRDRADIAVFQNHLADPEAVIERLLPFDVVCVMRERTPLPRNVIERLPNLKLIASTGSVNGSMSAPRAIVGSQWFTRGICRTRRSNLPVRLSWPPLVI